MALFKRILAITVIMVGVTMMIVRYKNVPYLTGIGIVLVAGGAAWYGKAK
jgi:hypothetical protein